MAHVRRSGEKEDDRTVRNTLTITTINDPGH